MPSPTYATEVTDPTYKQRDYLAGQLTNLEDQMIDAVMFGVGKP